MKLILLFLLILLNIQSVIAKNDSFFTYQGQLLNQYGKPIDSSFQIEFTLYAHPILQLDLWKEVHEITTKSGWFTVNLGSKVPFEIDFRQSLWLGMRIIGEDEQIPRIKLNTVPLAIHSLIADSLNGGIQGIVKKINGISDSVQLHGNGTIGITNRDNDLFLSLKYDSLNFTSDSIVVITSSTDGIRYSIREQSITDLQIKDRSISSEKLIDNDIPPLKLSSGGALVGQVLKWNGNIWLPTKDDYVEYKGGKGILINNDVIELDEYESSLKINQSISGDLSGTFPRMYIDSFKVMNHHLQDSTLSADKFQSGVIPVSLPPEGVAGGDLAGKYPNPSIANNVIGTSQLRDGSITSSKLAAGVIPTSLPPSGNAGGDLSGTYPNPSIADGVITLSKIASGVIPVTLPPSGSAGGDLSGTYPNPSIADGVITSSKIASGVIPVTLPPSGNAGGDLTGTFPNPSIANNAIGTSQLKDSSITSSKIASGVIPTSLPPSGTAGGDLSGTYPNPNIANNVIGTSQLKDSSITSRKIASGVIPTTLPPSGTAGGDLTGTFPNPSIANNAIGTSQLKDGSITSSKLAVGVIPTSLPPSGIASGDLIGLYPNPSIAIGVITASKLAAGVIPTSLPPSGNAGGDLSGTYPNPTIGIGKIQTSMLAQGSVTLPKLSGLGAVIGNTITWNGSEWTFTAIARDSLLYFRESRSNQWPNTTIPAHTLTTKGAESNIDFVISPKGTGSLLTSSPDNTANGGVKRGVYAVDLQLSRNANHQVASGNNSVLIGGANNAASGNASAVLSGISNSSQGYGSIILGGFNNQAMGQYSIAGGGYGNTAIGAYSIASGIYNTASNESNIAIGGSNNYSAGQYSAVIGGSYNYVTSPFGLAMSTYNANLTGSRSIILGGKNHSISSSDGIILGGSGLTLTGTAENSIGTLGNNNSNTRNMTISAANTMVLGNMDIWLASNDGTARGMYFYEPGSNSGSYPVDNHYSMIKAGPQQTSITYTLPVNPPSSDNQLLRVHTNGQMSWGNAIVLQQSINVDCPNLNPNGGIGFCDITFNGIQTGGIAHASPTEDLVAGICIASVRIIQSNTIRISFLNATGNAINPGPIPFHIAVIQ